VLGVAIDVAAGGDVSGEVLEERVDDPPAPVGREPGDLVGQ
jgi:hypothetical protein